MKIQVTKPDGTKLIIYKWFWTKRVDKLIAKFLRKEKAEK